MIMDEYSDQDIWFELQVQTTSHGWVTLSDFDTREEAQEAFDDHMHSDPVNTYRVHRVYGRAE